MNRCFLIKAVDKVYGELFLADVKENTYFNPDKEDAYVFTDQSLALETLDELKHNFPNYSFSLLVLNVE